MSFRRIYLDNNATTPTDPRVVEAMLPYFYDMPGNAASRHHPFGWEAEEAVDQARQQIAGLIGVEPKEIVFTSGATEADNLALKGVFERYHRKGNHIITLRSEHKAVLDSCAHIERIGGRVSYLEVDKEGLVDLKVLEQAMTDQTILVSIMWANNETGVIQPMAAIGELCARKGILLMSDATQAVGKIPVDPKTAGVQLLAFSAHKMYGPKGIGALYLCRRQPKVHLSAQLHGGGHEQGMRSGTLNVPAIAGFGKAAEIARQEMLTEAERLGTLRDRLEQALLKIEESYVNGSRTQRLPQVTNMAFRHVEGEALMMHFNRQLAVSSGSACTSASRDPSHVLMALGLGRERAHASLRLSLGRFNSEEEVDQAIALIRQGIQHLRSISPVWEMYQEGIDLEEAWVS